VHMTPDGYQVITLISLAYWPRRCYSLANDPELRLG